MDIGSKMQNARKNARLTQEQAAEALGVSRQTVSNWENGRTYPDIISVVKMSDLYAVSLDHLLKEAKPMSNYLDYLQESTDVVKSKTRQSKLILIAVYLTVWACSLLVFWLFADGSDAMAYSLVVLWILLPVVTFVLSALIGKNHYWGKYKWAAAVPFGILYMLAEYATFSAANTASFGNFHMPEWSMIPVGAAFSLAGLAIGSAVHYRQTKKVQKQTEK